MKTENFNESGICRLQYKAPDTRLITVHTRTSILQGSLGEETAFTEVNDC